MTLRKALASSQMPSDQAIGLNVSAGKIDWLASYPKSGNTWMRILLANYFNETDRVHDINAPGVTNGIASSRRRFDEVLGVSSSDLTASEVEGLRPDLYRILAEDVPDNQWMKVHDAQVKLADGRWLFPPECSGVVIYLIRNPLDVAVSLAFHDGDQDIDKSIAKMCAPKRVLSTQRQPQLPQKTGTWGDHVISWVDQTQIPTHVVRYEDMLEDTAATLADVLRFARPDAPLDMDKLSSAVEHSRFENLRRAEDANRFLEKPQKAKRFFRKGETGDWQNHLTESHVAKLCDTLGPVMERFGYAR